MLFAFISISKGERRHILEGSALLGTVGCERIVFAQNCLGGSWSRHVITAVWERVKEKAAPPYNEGIICFSLMLATDTWEPVHFLVTVQYYETDCNYNTTTCIVVFFGCC